MHSLFACSHTFCIGFWEYPRDSADWHEGTMVWHAKALEENEC